RPRTAAETAVIKSFNDLADRKEKASSFAGEILARLPPFSRSAGMDAQLLRTHAERLSAAIENAREGEPVVLWPVAHADPSGKYTSFSEGRGPDPFATIPLENGRSVELQTDPQYMGLAEFQTRVAAMRSAEAAWNSSGMAAMTAFNTLTGSMGSLEP